ncbi:MAG: tRNA-dihydrouridine synthase, partial [Dehalococcoidia bacterium]|nr:tRNA-dihydrouridine synthase [Dehalococcoidia bacterium]
MSIVKIVPCLDVKEGRVVKGVKFENLVDARDIVEAAMAYEQQGADEIVILDIAATVENRNTRLEWVRKLAAAIRIPFAVGGGIRTTEDMKALFDLGAAKVSINTAAVKNPDLISDAAKRFGGSRLVVAIDGKKNDVGSGAPRLEVVVSGGNEATGMDIVEWARTVEHLG